MSSWSPVGETIVEARIPLRFHGKDSGDVCVCMVEEGDLYLLVPGHPRGAISRDVQDLKREGSRVEVCPSIWFRRRGGRLVVLPGNIAVGSISAGAFDMAMRFIAGEREALEKANEE